MKKLLRIDCSPRTRGSHSRSIANYFESCWKSSNPNGIIIYRDLAINPIPHIKNETIEGFYTPKEELTSPAVAAITLSNELITELKSVNEVLISSPLFNLGISSNLKTYFDQVVRVGQTFNVNKDASYSGLLKTKAIHLVTAKGGSYKATPMEKHDFQVPHIQAVFQTMGVDTIHLYTLEGTSDINTLSKNKSLIEHQISKYFETIKNENYECETNNS